MAKDSIDKLGQETAEDSADSDTSEEHVSSEADESHQRLTNPRPEEELEGEMQEVTSARDIPNLRVVFRLGSKQYNARLLEEDVGETISGFTGTSVRVTEVMLATDGEKTAIGKPHIEDAHVDLEIIRNMRSERTISFKRRRRKHSSRTTKGHVQNLIRFRIVGISVPGFSPAICTGDDPELGMQT